MAKRQSVKELPQIGEGFPKLSIILPRGTTLLVFSSPLKNLEKECVLAIIATISIRNRGWKPICASELPIPLEEQVKALPMVHPQNIINSLWEMADDNLLKIVHYEGDGKDYIVPTPELAQMLEKSTVTYSY